MAAAATTAQAAPKRLGLLDRVLAIVKGANSRGVDANAALSVSMTEGLSGAVGDNGTSFGPFQLHMGGALPASVASQGAAYADAWANSQEGINYALDRIASVAKGQQGIPAITSIVTRFERPANPSAEISAATSNYTSGRSRTIAQQALAGTLDNSITGAAGSAAAGAEDAAKSAYDAALAVPNFLAKITNVHNILRGLQVLAGAVLVLVGVVLLARQVALANDLPDPLKSAPIPVPV